MRAAACIATGSPAWWRRRRRCSSSPPRQETEALLLESNLIKRLKPRYNVSYRDDKSFPNILLREDHPFPQLLKHRGAKTTKGIYFGPFASAGAVTRTLNTLQRAFLLRSCSDSVFDSAHPSLPAVPDQALQRALRGPAWIDAGYRDWWRKPKLPQRQKPHVQDTLIRPK